MPATKNSPKFFARMTPERRLAIITTHPIQYNAPLFKLLNEEDSFAIKVFYTSGQAKESLFDKDFGLFINWDIPLLEGYEYTFVDNVSPNPATNHFRGIVNPTLINEIEEWKADAVLVYGWAFSSHLIAIRHFYKKVPVLFRGDSTLIDEPKGSSIKKMVRRLFLTWMYGHVDFALYVGTANRQYFLAHGLKERQLLFAPHAVDNNRFSNDDNGYTQQAQSWRRILGIADDDIVFLFAAKLIKKKDPELLIKSFLALSNTHWWLIMVGNGELEKELKEKYGSHSEIIFIDFQNQAMMPVVYRLADVFVLPSKGPGETWGLAINEAMACAKAIIASDKCGCSYDLICKNENGYVFENGNLESLTSCLGLAQANCKEQGLRSAQMIKEWTYQKTVQQLKVLLTKTID